MFKSITDIQLQVEELIYHKQLNPIPSEMELIHDRWGIKDSIPIFALAGARDDNDIRLRLRSTWEHMYFSAARFVTSMCIGKNAHTAFHFEPIVRQSLTGMTVEFILMLDFFEVPTRDYHIPVFITDPQSLQPIEWKCGYCEMINPMKATYCGEKHEHACGCGHPRAIILRACDIDRVGGEYGRQSSLRNNH